MSTSDMSIAERKPSRPFLLRVVGLILLAIFMIAIYRFTAALTRPQLFDLAGLPGGLRIYLAGSGLAWALICLPAIIGLWLRKPWSGKATWAATVFYLLSYWMERIFLWQPDQNRQTWLFYAILSALWVALNLITFKLPSTKRFLKLNNDQFPKGIPDERP